MAEPEVLMLQKRFGVSETLAKIMALLARHEVVTVDMLQDEHQITKDARVAIHRLRRAVLDLDVKSGHKVGYWLELEDRRRVAKAMIPDQMELPLVGGGDGGSEATA